jgi:hypothetical protein
MKISNEIIHLRNEAYNFFLHHLMKEKSDGQLRTDNFIHARSAWMKKVVRPISPS